MSGNSITEKGWRLDAVRAAAPGEFLGDLRRNPTYLVCSG